MRGLEREAKVTIPELALQTSNSRSCSNFAHAIPSVIQLGKVWRRSSLLHMDLSISASEPEQEQDRAATARRLGAEENTKYKVLLLHLLTTTYSII